MKIRKRRLVEMLLYLGIAAVSQGRTLTPKSDPTANNNNKILLTTTSIPVFTSPLPKVTTPDRTTSSIPAIMAQKKNGHETAKNNTVVPAAKGHDDSNNDGLPLWVYILIGIGAVIVVIICVIIAYGKFMKWKDHGTYMVWDDAELETSPAFTRESEFLLETQAGIQENTPELQLYEIPLDSVTAHPKITYMGSKRVAPKRQEEKRSSKDYKKKDGEYHTPSLTKYTKRDTVYNSVTDTCITSVLSEGTLDGHGSTSSHTLATVMFSNGGLDKYDSTSQFNTIDTKQRDKSHSMGSRTRSVSNLIQSRPLPAVPINKRFSKSLDKFRFFNTLPVIKTHNPPRAKLFYGEPPYSNLIKSASYGSNLHRTVNNNICLPVMLDQPPLFATRKCSLDIHSKLPVSKLNHRKSKSLDTLTLLKGIDFNVTNVDIYHSYESVHNKDAEYASVTDSQPNSPTPDFTPQHSPTKLKSPSHTDHESIYSSLSHEDLQRTGSQEGENDSYVGYDSGTLSSVSSDATSPYASVRISQIPGLSYDQNDHENIYRTKSLENSGESVENMTPENSGSSAVELKPAVNSARSSTHTYIELFPEQNNRDSTISETSSGYARPVDVINGTNLKSKEHRFSGKANSLKRKSLTDVEIPIESVTFDRRSINSEEVYDNPVNISDDSTHDTSDISGDVLADSINLDDSVDDLHINIRPLLKRSDSDHSECEI